MREWDALRAIVRQRLPDRTPLVIVRAFPVTLVFLTIITGVGMLTARQTSAEHHHLLERYGFDYDMLRAGQLHHLLTGMFVQSEPGIAASMLVLVATALAPCELLAGSRRTLIAMLVCDWLSSLLTVLALRGLSGLGVTEATRLLHVADAGSSAAAHGAYAVAATLLPGRLAAVAYGVLVAMTVVLLFQQSLPAALAHLFAVLIGGALGWCWRDASLSRHMA